MGSEAAGLLERVAVEEGDFVRRGQTIAVIAHDDLRSALDAAEAQLQLEEAEFRLLMNGSREEERREAREGVKEAEAVLRNAETEANRCDALYVEGLVSRAELDRAREKQQISAARFDAAQERYSLIVAPPRQEEQPRGEARVRLARAKVAEARARIEKATVRSPISGTVLRRFRNTGEVVTPASGAAIVSIGDLTVCRVRAEIDETDIARVRVGQRAYVTAEAYGDKRFWGRVLSVGPVLGQKNLRSDDPAERQDATILETLVALPRPCTLSAGLRVKTFIQTGQ